jgi:hypothetical protein
MAGLDPATQQPRVGAASDLHHHVRTAYWLADARRWVAGSSPAMVKLFMSSQLAAQRPDV